MYKRDEDLKRFLKYYQIIMCGQNTQHFRPNSSSANSEFQTNSIQSQNVGPLLPSHIVATTLLPWSLGQDFSSN